MADAIGNLRVPADYRTAYQSLGGWAVATDNGQGSKEIHAVYASPGTIAAYRKDGRFPDGSVLVKEVFSGGYRNDDDRHCQPCPNIEGLVCNGEGQ